MLSAQPVDDLGDLPVAADEGVAFVLGVRLHSRVGARRRSTRRGNGNVEQLTDAAQRVVPQRPLGRVDPASLFVGGREFEFLEHHGDALEHLLFRFVVAEVPAFVVVGPAQVRAREDDDDPVGLGDRRVERVVAELRAGEVEYVGDVDVDAP